MRRVSALPDWDGMKYRGKTRDQNKVELTKVQVAVNLAAHDAWRWWIDRDVETKGGDI